MSEETTEAEGITGQEQVLLLPGHAFFVDRLELPPGLESKELPDYAQLSLETLAPFPVEQLNWGYVADQAAGHLLLYATHRERLAQLGYSELERYLWVLPDFAPFACERNGQDQCLLLENGDAVTRIQLRAGETLPESIIARANREELPDIGEASLYRLRVKTPRVTETGRAVFLFQPENAEGAKDSGEAAAAWSEVAVAEPLLWMADVRSPDFKSAEQNRRQMAAWITRATAYAGIGIAVLLALELVLVFANSWVGLREATIAEQLPEVRRIEDKQSLMNKLDQVAQNELRPIAILEALNSARPNGIYFTDTVTEGRNRITVDGIADTINALNAYIDALRGSGQFELIGSPKQITRSGKTTFTVTLDYLHRPQTEGGTEG